MIRRKSNKLSETSLIELLPCGKVRNVPIKMAKSQSNHYRMQIKIWNLIIKNNDDNDPLVWSVNHINHHEIKN